MKRSSLSYLISAGALLAALAPVASHAQAAWDGQIRFTGSVSDTTCSVNGGQGSASNITDVRLGNVDPTAAVKALAVGANIGSKQTFKISLSTAACSRLCLNPPQAPHKPKREAPPLNSTRVRRTSMEPRAI